MRQSLASVRPGSKRFLLAGGAAVLIVCIIGVAAYTIRRPTEQSKYSAARSPTATLNSNYSIPLLGLGTFRASGRQAYHAVISGVKLGYRHIDTAAVYKNEEQVGAALAEIFKEGVVKREDMFVTTKLWDSEHAQDALEPALRESLRKLQLSYVDLYLVHWPCTGKPGTELDPPMQETWRGMESVVGKGLARSIGVSNHSPEKIERWLSDARIQPAVNQIEMHPNWRNDRVLDWAKEHGIHITAYAPLSSPDTAATEDAPNLMKDATILKIAQANQRTTQQVLLSWGLQHGGLQHVSVIPKSANADHQKSNFDALDGQLPEADFNAITGFEKQIRYFTGDLCISEDSPYHSYQDLWDEPPQ